MGPDDVPPPTKCRKASAAGPFLVLAETARPAPTRAPAAPGSLWGNTCSPRRSEVFTDASERSEPRCAAAAKARNGPAAASLPPPVRNSDSDGPACPPQK
jgi:hypothetical protein